MSEKPQVLKPGTQAFAPMPQLPQEQRQDEQDEQDAGMDDQGITGNQ